MIRKFIVLFILMIVSCSPSKSFVTTEFLIPMGTLHENNEQMLGSWLDNYGWARTITINKVNETYKMASGYSDGSGESITLGVKVVNGETRLYETQNPFGGYMVIKSDGSLAFYDNQ
jgi:hypothetical protein